MTGLDKRNTKETKRLDSLWAGCLLLSTYLTLFFLWRRKWMWDISCISVKWERVQLKIHSIHWVQSNSSVQSVPWILDQAQVPSLNSALIKLLFNMHAMHDCSSFRRDYDPGLECIWGLNVRPLRRYAFWWIIGLGYMYSAEHNSKWKVTILRRQVINSLISLHKFFCFIKLLVSVKSFPPVCYRKEVFKSSPESWLIPSWHTQVDLSW